MKTIIVPTDFSDNAEHALKYAVQLAKADGSKIVLLHCYHFIATDPQAGWDTGFDQESILREAGEKKLTSISKKHEKASGVTFEWVNELGFLVDSISKVVKRKKADLVVMGTQGASGLTEIIMGSNTADVVGKVACPVLVIPANASYKKMKRLVYATDYHTGDLKAIEYLVSLAKGLDAKVDVVHMAHEDTSYTTEHEYFVKFTSKVNKKISYKKLHFYLLFGVDVEKSLEKYIDKEGVDLVALSTKHRGLLERLFGKSSFTKKLIYHTHVPLIAFHHK